MIVLDTHVWIWWVQGDERLVTPEIAVQATELPGSIHRDPIDQILIATTRKASASIMTMDGQIIAYPHVRKYASQG